VTGAAKQFRVPGGPTLVYDEIGDPAAPPVVLLHGLSAGRRPWSEWLGVGAALAEDHHVFALDQRGHGDSDRTPGEYLLRHFAADLVAFVDGAIGRPAALVGHSLGGLVSAQVAAIADDVVRAAVLVDIVSAAGVRNARPPGVSTFWAPLAASLRHIHDRAGTIDDVVDMIRPMSSFLGGYDGGALDADQLRRFAMLWHQWDPYVVDGLADESFIAGHDARTPIPCPVHLLRAELPPCVPSENEARFLATHPRASAQVIPGTNHFTILESERLVEALQAFLRDA